MQYGAEKLHAAEDRLRSIGKHNLHMELASLQQSVMQLGSSTLSSVRERLK
jgi:hypothetical protein